MGSNKEEKDVSCRKFREIVSQCAACFASFLTSVVGGGILLWWDLKYHPQNKQLWMVPFGLIILVTPLVVCFSSYVSDICCSAVASSSAINQPLDNTVVRDMERGSNDEIRS